MLAYRIINPGPLCGRTPLSDYDLHHLNTLVLRPCLHPPRCPVQDCPAVVRWFIDWSLRFAGLSHNIPVLAYCIFLEQGHRGRALHQCTRTIHCSRHIFPCPGHLCRRTPTAYDLEASNNQTREGCDQRSLPSRFFVRSIFTSQKEGLG